MSTEETQSETSAEDLTDELAKKYDPERLLKMFQRRLGKADPLDPTTRAKYEKRFGVDLGHVRVVTGEFAEEFNRKREAFAVTVGSTGLILMGNSPEKSMGSAAGQALLAHELTHVAQAQRQQSARGLNRAGQFDGAMAFTQEHEVEAHQVEHEVEREAQGGASAAEAARAKAEAEEAKKQTIEKIKARVLEMAGDAMRNTMSRNGSARRA